MRLDRRRLLHRATAAAGATLLLRPLGALGGPLAPDDAYGTSRASRLFPGQRLVHADLHNHTRLSDGDGDPALAFDSMRDAGLDVAALTDHAVLNSPDDPLRRDVCAGISAIPEVGDGCGSLAGITEESWALTGQLAAERTTGDFLAVRGFEWSSPTLGHVNVWFTSTWIDVLSTAGLGAGASAETLIDPVGDGIREIPGVGDAATALVLPLVDGLLDGLQLAEGPVAMALLHRWLSRPDDEVFGGGGSGFAGFNHPGREVGRFGEFAYSPALADRIVSLELLNRREDYLFEGTDRGEVSPLVQCLAAGWRPGILGVTDEHGTDWGRPAGKGRGGFWVGELSIVGMKEALLNRRFYATRVRGLRLDVACNAVRMGGVLGHPGGPVRVQVDLDTGGRYAGRELVLQVLSRPRDGGAMPAILHTSTVRADGPVIDVLVPDVDPAASPWLVVRLSDPAHEPTDDLPFERDVRAEGVWAELGAAWAYASPVWLDPALAPPADDRAPLMRGDAGAGGGPVGAPSPTPAPTTTPDPTAPPTGQPSVTATVRRRGGATRIETAVELSRSTFPVGVPVVFVAQAGAFPDALAAVPAVAPSGGPLLLVEADAVPAVVAAELDRLTPDRIVVLGGTEVVADPVVEALGAHAEDVVRIAGADRYATSAAIVAAWFASADEVVVATGTDFADALASGPAIARVGGPLLLVRPDGVPDVVAAELDRLSPERILVVGGAGAIADEVVDALGSHAAVVERIAGADRIATAAAICAARFASADEVVVATGADFADALAAGPAAVMRGAPVLLVERDRIPPATDAQLRRLGPLLITIAGGPGAVSAAVEEALATYPAT
ncbi:cell wall-binding repeat-containing protein [Euzebya sp.]|uniref:cell wall-binding repeat-containing protein n=1 Tax=Euzebya sp. TaxID=1971409 RepID=UPI003515154E